MKAELLPTQPPDLLTWAQGVIPALELYFAEHNVSLPLRRRIVPGQLQLDAWDCEQVSVGFAGITDPSRQGTVLGAPRTGNTFAVMKTRQAAYGIQIVRCVGCNDPVWSTNTDEFGQAGEDQLRDAALISQFMINMASSPPDWHPEGVNADAGDVTPLGPSGGYYALEASIIFTVMARTAS